MLPLSRLWQLIPPTLAAVLCMYLAALPPLAQNGISPLTLAIVLGMALGNSVAAPHLPRIAEGIAFSKGRLLRLGIVLYGFKITWAQLAFAGWPALLAPRICRLTARYTAKRGGARMSCGQRCCARWVDMAEWMP